MYSTGIIKCIILDIHCSHIYIVHVLKLKIPIFPICHMEIIREYRNHPNSQWFRDILQFFFSPALYDRSMIHVLPANTKFIAKRNFIINVWLRFVLQCFKEIIQYRRVLIKHLWKGIWIIWLEYRRLITLWLFKIIKHFTGILTILTIIVYYVGDEQISFSLPPIPSIYTPSFQSDF